MFKTKRNSFKRKINLKEMKARVLLFSPTYPIIASSSLTSQVFQLLRIGETGADKILVCRNLDKILTPVSAHDGNTCGKIARLRIHKRSMTANSFQSRHTDGQKPEEHFQLKLLLFQKISTFCYIIYCL